MEGAMSVEIPVYLVDRLGDKSADNVNCTPCIDVVLVGTGLATKGVAMLDSGATAIYADPAVIQLTELPIVGYDTYYGVGYER
jgi:hypothetical protein